MSTTRRQQSIPVIRKLYDDAAAFRFVQAVRLLERFAALSCQDGSSLASKPVARFLPPTSESVRFHANSSLSFAPSEIDSISLDNSAADTHRQPQLTVNFISLTGAAGVLPYHYTELLLQRLKLKDKTLAAFFDLFNHRTISLFYQASVKYRLPLEYERNKLNPLPGSATDSHTQVLLSLVGLGTKKLTQRLYTRDESLLYYAGLFSSKIRTAHGLSQILQHHFRIPVEIKEFIGEWQDLIDDVRTRMPSVENRRGQNNSLGKSVMLGRKGWFAQAKFHVILGPLSPTQLHQFAPGTATLKALDEIVRLYVNFEHSYEFIMRIRRADIPGRIALSKAQPPVMGWNTWLASSALRSADPEQTVDIPVSPRRIKISPATFK